VAAPNPCIAWVSEVSPPLPPFLGRFRKNVRSGIWVPKKSRDIFGNPTEKGGEDGKGGKSAAVRCRATKAQPPPFRHLHHLCQGTHRRCCLTTKLHELKEVAAFFGNRKDCQ